MPVEVEIPLIAARYPEVVMVQSTRHGGVSKAPYTSLNLGLNTGDAPEAVSENRRRFFEAIGTSELQVAGGYQVHGTGIKVVETPGSYDGYDAFVTGVPGIFLCVTIADCVPVLIYDPVKKAVAAIHAGWRGTVGEIALKTIDCLVETFGTEPSDCIAYIGTSISYDCFEVSAEVANEFDGGLKRPGELPGKYMVDLKEANRRQLLRAGLKEEFTEVSSYCTAADNTRFFSHRKEGGKTGRMLAVVAPPLSPPQPT